MNIEEIKCPICGFKSIEYIDTRIRNVADDSLKMYKCKDCETHFIYPLPTVDKLEEYYDGTFRKEVHKEVYYTNEVLKMTFDRFTPEAMQRVERVSKDLKETDEILEIGCSVGYFMSAISSKVKLAYGTEWDSKAREFIEHELDTGKIKTAKNPQDFNMKFDKIFMFHVLEHIERPIEFLKELKPVLKTGGKLYIEVPNVDDVMVSLYGCRAFKEYYYKKAHIYNFNEKGLKYIFDKAGFKNYTISFIERYDLSNHLGWLAKGIATQRQNIYGNVITKAVNDEYVKSLVDNKMTDTLFAVVDV